MPKDLKRKVAAAPEPGQTSKNFVDGLDDLKANPKPQATPPSKMSFKTREGAYGCQKCSKTYNTRRAVGDHWKAAHKEEILQPTRTPRRTRAVSRDAKLLRLLYPKPKTFGLKTRDQAGGDLVRLFHCYGNAQLKKTIHGQERIVFKQKLEAEASATDEDLVARTRRYLDNEIKQAIEVWNENYLDLVENALPPPKVVKDDPVPTARTSRYEKMQTQKEAAYVAKNFTAEAMKKYTAFFPEQGEGGRFGERIPFLNKDRRASLCPVFVAHARQREVRRKNRESRFQATYDARDFTADSRRKYKRFNTEQEAMMDLIGKAAPPAPKAASPAPKAAPPAPKAAPLTETFSTVTAIRKSSRGATVREKDDDAALMRKYKERQLHAIRLEAEHKKRYTEADLAADELKWNRNRFTTRRYCEQCNLFFLVRSMSEIFGCPQHHHEHLDVIGSLKWENKMFFPVDVYPKAVQPKAAQPEAAQSDVEMLSLRSYELAVAAQPDVEMLSSRSCELAVAVQQSKDLAMAAQPDVDVHSQRSCALALAAESDTDKIEWSYGDEWSQGNEPNGLALQFDCLKIDQQSELEGPHQSFASDYYVELSISYGEEASIEIPMEASIEIPISYDEESDCEVYDYCHTEGDCRPEMTYLGYSSDDAIAKSLELNALDIVRQMYRTPSETSLNVTEKSEC